MEKYLFKFKIEDSAKTTDTVLVSYIGVWVQCITFIVHYISLTLNAVLTL